MPERRITCLVENQFGPSDADHLRRIQRYLDASKARRAVWIAPEFSDRHLQIVRDCNLRRTSPSGFYTVLLGLTPTGLFTAAAFLQVVEGPHGAGMAVPIVDAFAPVKSNGVKVGNPNKEAARRALSHDERSQCPRGADYREDVGGVAGGT